MSSLRSLNSEGLRFGATNFCQILFFLHICLCMCLCLAYTSKKCKFWRHSFIHSSSFEGDPVVVLPNFVKFYLYYLPILKISSVLCEWFSFEFWRSCLRGIPSFWYPQILSNFIFSSHLPILKISSIQHKWLNFEFWRPCLMRIPSFWYQISSNFIFSYLRILKISCV